MIVLTDAASNKIKKLLSKRSNSNGIRIGVRTTGCSGLAYVLEYADTLQSDDVVLDCGDCKICIDPKSYVYLQNMTIDYTREGLNEGFKFSNPNERDRCGCGESFRV